MEQLFYQIEMRPSYGMASVTLDGRGKVVGTPSLSDVPIVTCPSDWSTAVLLPSIFIPYVYRFASNPTLQLLNTSGSMYLDIN